VLTGVSVLSGGAYLQLRGPSFADRYRHFTEFDYVVNTRYTLQGIDADSVANAVEAGRGVVRVIWNGPNETDEVIFTSFNEVDDAIHEFAQVRSSSAEPVDPPYGGFFVAQGGFCSARGPGYRCAVRFDDTVVEGIAVGGRGTDPAGVLDGAQTLTQAGVKNLHQMNLDLGI
jgi:hypothetical protein